MSNFTPLYGSILTSTIWAEDAETRLVWITMLAMADASGYVGASIPGLAHAARVSTDGCRKAIDKFLGPDPDSRTKENDGRRIDEADGGWLLLNYDRHRERATEIRHNALSAIRMRELRAKRKKEGTVANVPEQSEQLQSLPDVPQARQGIGKAEEEITHSQKKDDAKRLSDARAFASGWITQNCPQHLRRIRSFVDLILKFGKDRAVAETEIVIASGGGIANPFAYAATKAAGEVSRNGDAAHKPRGFKAERFNT